MRHLILLLTTSLAAPALAADPAAVADTYADIAEATYGDSLTTAKAWKPPLRHLSPPRPPIP